MGTQLTLCAAIRLLSLISLNCCLSVTARSQALAICSLNHRFHHESDGPALFRCRCPWSSDLTPYPRRVKSEHVWKPVRFAAPICTSSMANSPNSKLPLVPGHEIVGIVDAVGSGVETVTVGTRVGIPWLGHTCGQCEYCLAGRENLCDRPIFTGYTRDGGFATHVVADAAYAFPPMSFMTPSQPLPCCGWPDRLALIAPGRRRKKIGLYGFGAAAHILAQVCRWQDRDVYAFTRAGDSKAQSLALTLGAKWVGSSNDAPPTLLDAAIIFAPAGELSRRRLAASARGAPLSVVESI